MRFSAFGAAFSTLLLAGCTATGTGGAINAATQIGVAAINTALEATPGKKIEITVNMQPSLVGEPLQVGLPVVVGIDPVLSSGVHCYSCVIHWHSDKPDRAAWADFKEVGGRRFATIEPKAPGNVVLTVEICPGAPYACQRHVMKMRVVA
jgi:hypothetical protein